MREAAEWLQKIEHEAMDLYRRAAERFSDDENIRDFFLRLAEDEESHSELMKEAAALFAEMDATPSPPLLVDLETRGRVMGLLQKSKGILEDPSASKRDILGIAAQIESSEWNDIFLYVMELCRERSRSFQRIPAEIQAHEERVEVFLAQLPSGLKPSTDLAELPRIWEHTFLVVDDEELVLRFMARFLGKRGAVETATDGGEALEKIKRSFYDVILSDADMRAMDGLEFLSKAASEDESIKRHFVFLSGKPSREIQQVCQQDGIPFLLKPARMNQILEAVELVLNKN